MRLKVSIEYKDNSCYLFKKRKEKEREGIPHFVIYSNVFHTFSSLFFSAAKWHYRCLCSKASTFSSNSIQSIIRKTPRGFCGFLVTQRVLLQYFCSAYCFIQTRDWHKADQTNSTVTPSAISAPATAVRAQTSLRPMIPRGGEMRGESSLTLIKKSNHDDEAPALQQLA